MAKKEEKKKVETLVKEEPFDPDAMIARGLHPNGQPIQTSRRDIEPINETKSEETGLPEKVASLSKKTRDKLEDIARELGLNPVDYTTKRKLAEAIVAAGYAVEEGGE